MAQPPQWLAKLIMAKNLGAGDRARLAAAGRSGNRAATYRREIVAELKRLADRKYMSDPNAAHVAGGEVVFPPETVTRFRELLQRTPLQKRGQEIPGLNPDLQAKLPAILAALRARGWDPYVPATSGVRTAQQQQALKAQGRSRLSRGPHMYGAAVDIVPRKHGWNAPPEYWQALGEAAQQQGLTWGGAWKSFYDPAHVELTNWRRNPSPRPAAPRPAAPRPVTPAPVPAASIVLQPGQTLSHIARSRQIPVSKLLQLNPQYPDPTKIPAGARIKTGQAKSEYAPGIPEKGVTGDPLQTLKPDDLVTYVLQHHETRRRPGRPHFDLRLGTPETGLFSWAVPKARLPGPGERRLAPQTEVHDYGYGEFSGDIGSGYGAGRVTLSDRGKALITRVSPNAVHFTIAHAKVPQRYMLVRTGTGRGGRDWLLVNKTITKAPEAVGTKPDVRLIAAEGVRDAIDQAHEVQAKIDGASAVVEVDPRGRPEVYSVRKRVTGEPIVHTERLGLHMAPDMPELAGTVLRGEITGLRKGKAIPFKDVGGILNSVIAKSRGMQEASDIDMHTVLFNVLKHKGVDVSKKPAPERMALLREISKQLSPHFQAVPGATTVEDKRKLMETIRTGKHPLTTEGTILHMPGGQTLKQKNVKETTLYLVGTYPGSGKRETTAGGILASTKPDGSGTLVRIGTGFDDDELKNIINNIDDYKGRALRVQHQGQFETGLLRAPSFKGFETDAGVKKAWIAVDLDGTAAKYDGWKGETHIGAPIPTMLARIKRWLRDGKDVRIFTARVSNGKGAIDAVKAWCQQHIGTELPVTNVKDQKMEKLWDDRAVTVEKNTGANKAAADAPTAAQVAAAAAKADTSPSEAQKDSGTYRKGHIRIRGLDITIENPKDSIRSGTSANGTTWQTRMTAHYGYIKRTESEADGDHIDVFIGPNPKSWIVFVVDQCNPKTGAFDEHKCVLGCKTKAEAKALYLSNYERGWRGCMAVTAMLMPAFKRWIVDGDTSKPLAKPVAVSVKQGYISIPTGVVGQLPGAKAPQNLEKTLEPAKPVLKPVLKPVTKTAQLEIASPPRTVQLMPTPATPPVSSTMPRIDTVQLARSAVATAPTPYSLQYRKWRPPEPVGSDNQADLDNPEIQARLRQRAGRALLESTGIRTLLPRWLDLPRISRSKNPESKSTGVNIRMGLKL